MFESDVPVVLTSKLEKGESLIWQDLGCRPGDPISPISDDECVLLCPLLCGVLHYRPRTKPLNSRALVEMINSNNYRCQYGAYCFIAGLYAPRKEFSFTDEIRWQPFISKRSDDMIR
ncbi:hypothetical protein AVEN_230537-1, partial [Araneus ventricosus]